MKGCRESLVLEPNLQVEPRFLRAEPIFPHISHYRIAAQLFGSCKALEKAMICNPELHPAEQISISGNPFKAFEGL